MVTPRKTTTQKAIKVAKTPTLTKVEQKRIKQLGAAWKLDEAGKKLTATFDFDRYLDGFMFATRVSVHAEVLNHHPELCITPHQVKVILTTHSAKGVTALDIELAERINTLLSTHR
jgi:4a-hydroxytetrahydrobiopterin dehydratase